MLPIAGDLGDPLAVILTRIEMCTPAGKERMGLCLLVAAAATP